MESKHFSHTIYLVLISFLWLNAHASAADKIPEPTDLALVEEPRLLRAIDSAKKTVIETPNNATI